jgi:hypothetical protein
MMPMNDKDALAGPAGLRDGEGIASSELWGSGWAGRLPLDLPEGYHGTRRGQGLFVRLTVSREVAPT